MQVASVTCWPLIVPTMLRISSLNASRFGRPTSASGQKCGPTRIFVFAVAHLLICRQGHLVEPDIVRFFSVITVHLKCDVDLLQRPIGLVIEIRVDVVGLIPN